MGFAIAIDGTAGSGKGTLSRQLAAHYGFPCLHTGLLYRAVAAAVLDAHGTQTDFALACSLVDKINFSDLDEAALEQSAIGELASHLAQHPPLRAQLVAHQRTFALSHPNGAILEGRDIGTIILPDARVKFYITADLEQRALRRHQQLAERLADDARLPPPPPPSLAALTAALRDRDQRDSSRETAPLKIAPDALLLDSTKVGIIELTNQAIQLINAARQ